MTLKPADAEMAKIEFTFVKVLGLHLPNRVELRLIPVRDPSNYAFAGISSAMLMNAKMVLNFKRALYPDEIIQAILLTDAGTKWTTSDYCGVQFFRICDVQRDSSVTLFDVPSRRVVADFHVSAVSMIKIDQSADRHQGSIDHLDLASTDYVSKYMIAIKDLDWKVPELAKTHLAVWPVSAPSPAMLGARISSTGDREETLAIGYQDRSDRSISSLPPSVLRLPAYLLSKVSADSAIDIAYLRRLFNCLADLRGISATEELNVRMDYADRIKNVDAILELLGDLTTAIQLNVEYLPDVDTRKIPRERIKFPEMDNFGGEDCEGLAASSYRVWRILQLHGDPSNERRRGLSLFAQVLEFANRYDPVILTASAASGIAFNFNSDQLIRSGRLICHVFCAAFPKSGESAILKPLLLEGTNQAERIAVSGIDAQRASEQKMIVRLRQNDAVREMLKRFDVHYPEEPNRFYRYVVEWWDESGSYLIRGADRKFGIPFQDFMRCTAKTRDSVFSLEPLPRISQALTRAASDLAFKFVPQGFSWPSETVVSSLICGGLKIIRQGSRTTAFSFRIHNVKREQAIEAYRILLSAAVNNDEQKICMHRLVLSAVVEMPQEEGGGGGRAEVGESTRREFCRDFYQISVKIG